MAQKHVLMVSEISSYFSDEQIIFRRGENALQSDDVINMRYNDELKLIKGAVHASMRDKLYQVEISLGETKNIASASCSCPRGQVKCHHMAALASLAHYNISVTDQACSWTQPKPKASLEAIKISDLFPVKKPYRASKRTATEAEIEQLRQNLDSFGGAVGYTWLLSRKIEEPLKPLAVAVDEVLFCEEFQKCTTKIFYFEEKLKISSEQALKIAEETIGQRSNPLWLVVRKFRLTASNFGAVLGCCRRNRYPPSLFKKLLGTYNLDGVKSVKWGQDNEKDAIETFSAETGLVVTRTGLWLDHCGYLGASPDSLVGDDAIVEIKCPFKYRNSDLIAALKKDKDYICRTDANDQLIINKQHDYYHQIQGQLHITRRKLCYLGIWIPGRLHIVQVERDEEWGVNLKNLSVFYLSKFLQHILNDTM